MIMTKNDLLQLLKRPTYKRFVLAFDNRKSLEEVVKGNIGDGILAAIAAQHPQFYNDYESDSMLINDMLQLVVVNYFRKNIKNYDYLKMMDPQILYQSRLLRNSIKEYGQDKGLVIGEEIASMFSWYCWSKDNDWFMRFIPDEMHQGGYDWRENLGEKWKVFTAAFK